MSFKSLIRLIGAASCASLLSCGGIESDDEDSQEAGYSLDDAPRSQNRYMAGPGNIPPGQTTSTETVQTPVDSTSTTTTITPPVETTVTPPSTTTSSTTTATSPSAPAYGSPVPGRRGFVYPPGVESKPENMVDVRDFTPGQKVRDPRTGKIFLVP